MARPRSSRSSSSANLAASTSAMFAPHSSSHIEALFTGSSARFCSTASANDFASMPSS